MLLSCKPPFPKPNGRFHGEKDDIVAANLSKAMVKALEEAGSKSVKHTWYPDAKHDSCTETYRNPKMWEWMLSQKLSDRKK